MVHRVTSSSIKDIAAQNRTLADSILPGGPTGPEEMVLEISGVYDGGCILNAGEVKQTT